MYIRIPDAVIPLTGDGTVDGFVTVAADTVLHPGTIVNLYSADAGSLECIVTENVGGKVGLRATPQSKDDKGNLNYGRTAVAAWTVAGGAQIFVEKQYVMMQPVAQAKPA